MTFRRLYVDDVVLLGKSVSEIKNVKKMLRRELDIKDLRDLRSFLGLTFTCDASGNSLSQKQYVREVLRRFGMDDCNPVATPAVKNGKQDDGKMVPLIAQCTRRLWVLFSIS